MMVPSHKLRNLFSDGVVHVMRHSSFNVVVRELNFVIKIKVSTTIQVFISSDNITNRPSLNWHE